MIRSHGSLASRGSACRPRQTTCARVIRRLDVCDSRSQFQWRGEFAGETIIFSAKVGRRDWRTALLQNEEFTVTGRAVTDGRVLRFPASLFPELVQRMPE